MMNEVELFRTTDFETKKKVVETLIRERISYLEKQQKIPFLKRSEYNGSQNVYIICVSDLQKDAADEILKGLDLT